jgi:hypothetical protein
LENKGEYQKHQADKSDSALDESFLSVSTKKKRKIRLLLKKPNLNNQLDTSVCSSKLIKPSFIKAVAEAQSSNSKLNLSIQEAEQPICLMSPYKDTNIKLRTKEPQSDINRRKSVEALARSFRETP